MAILQMVDAVGGSETAGKLFDLFVGRTQLTDEQRANLESNYRDYVERIARLRAEQG
jgi:hypothetical protein